MAFLWELSISITAYYLRLHAAQYRTEETDHAEVFDNIDRFNGQFLQNRRYRKQHRAAETKHIADKLVLSWYDKTLIFFLPRSLLPLDSLSIRILLIDNYQ